MNTNQNDKQNKRYRKKYKYMKMRIKSLIVKKFSMDITPFASWCDKFPCNGLVILLQPKLNQSVMENAALCDEVAKVQESILIVKDERRFLLHKLLEYENDNEVSQVFFKNDSVITSNGSRTKIKKRQSCDDTR